jgi:hypothetical protein
MESLPSELVFHIVQNLPIGDSMNLFTTCRRLMKIGATFVKVFLHAVNYYKV